MRKLLGITAVLLLLSGCTILDGESRRAFEREQAEDSAVLALQGRLEDVPGVEVATVAVTPASGTLDPNGEPTDRDYLEVWVTMTRVDLARLVEVAGIMRDIVLAGPLAGGGHELIVQAGGREALRMNDFTITDDLLLEDLQYWFTVRGLVNSALSLRIGFPSYGGDYARTLTAPPATPMITSAYTAAFPEISEIPDVTLGVPLVELTGLRLRGELPPLGVMETFGRIIPRIRLLEPTSETGNLGHVSLDWRYTPFEKSGAVYGIYAVQEVDSGEDELREVAEELAGSGAGPTTLRSYLITRPGSLRFDCEAAEYPFPDDFALVDWLRAQGVPVSAAANAGYCNTLSTR